MRFLSRPKLGFTLVELLIVIPVVILALATIIGFMLVLVGGSIVAQERSKSAFNIQDSLTRIEQDIKLSSSFMSNLSALNPGQGKNATTDNMTDTTPFSSNVTTTSDTLILYKLATYSDPFDSSRTLVYYTNQPDSCASASVSMNRPMYTKTVYFVKSNTLWRRTVVPQWNTNTGVSVNAYSVCNKPWQRSSCPMVSSPNCKAVDEKLADNVSAFNIAYYDSSNNSTSAPVEATNVKVTISTSASVAGGDISDTYTLKAARSNSTQDTESQMNSN